PVSRGELAYRDPACGQRSPSEARDPSQYPLFTNEKSFFMRGEFIFKGRSHGHETASPVSDRASIGRPGIEFAARGAGTSDLRHEERVRLNPMRFWARAQAPVIK